MNHSELISFLGKYKTQPKKSLSQTFLTDLNVLQKIIQTAQVGANDTVLEIGPGPGSLTTLLLNTGCRVIAIEKDAILADALHRIQTNDERLTTINNDALAVDLTQWTPSKVVANLPYHITARLMGVLMPLQIPSYTLMVQKEVGERVKGSPKSKNYSALTLFCQYYTNITATFIVKASSFYPQPKVDSMVLHLQSKTTPLADPAPFFALVRKAFQKRRKMLTTSLGNKEIGKWLTDIGCSPQARPEELDLTQWLYIFEKYRRTFSNQVISTASSA
ncbi:MAG: ribosomal smaLL subunit methyltransferase [Chlamydiota bacterium]|jgi:16S rRNA (adenine1518-N6/adenine1519-N6)-dimethyltransferase